MELLSIGGFAAATWPSTTALRLYGEKSLLPPAGIDGTTGYCRYHPDQVETARLITLHRIDTTRFDFTPVGPPCEVYTPTHDDGLRGATSHFAPPIPRH